MPDSAAGRVRHVTAHAFWSEARKSFHAALFKAVLKIDENGVPSNADKSSKVSVKIAQGIMERLGAETKGARLAGQMSGRKFEKVCEEYIRQTFDKLKHMRPGKWEVAAASSITSFDQYEHLADVAAAAAANPKLEAALGIDYLIKPDVVVLRYPEDDSTINADGVLVDQEHARHSSVRSLNNQRPILHASISCKWTLRSDRAQNARSEALNLIRNRKGRLPHVMVVTGEPTPGRIASLALGTGDIDCVYHFALPELVETVGSLQNKKAIRQLDTMIQGKRLRDVSDLPLDLII